MKAQQGRDLAPQILIARAGVCEEGVALVRRPCQSGLQQLIDLSPSFRRHNGSLKSKVESRKLALRISTFHFLLSTFYFPLSSRRSQALAVLQSRSTVTTDTPRTSAISSELSPPK